MEAFFILPDAEAGDARDDMYLSVGGITHRIAAAQVPRMAAEINTLRTRNDELYAASKDVADVLAAAEWSTPEDAERYLEQIINNYWPALRAVVYATARATPQGKAGT